MTEAMANGTYRFGVYGVSSKIKCCHESVAMTEIEFISRQNGYQVDNEGVQGDVHEMEVPCAPKTLLSLRREEVHVQPARDEGKERKDERGKVSVNKSSAVRLKTRQCVRETRNARQVSGGVGARFAMPNRRVPHRWLAARPAMQMLMASVREERSCLLDEHGAKRRRQFDSSYGKVRVKVSKALAAARAEKVDVEQVPWRTRCGKRSLASRGCSSPPASKACEQSYGLGCDGGKKEKSRKSLIRCLSWRIDLLSSAIAKINKSAREARPASHLLSQAEIFLLSAISSDHSRSDLPRFTIKYKRLRE